MALTPEQLAIRLTGIGASEAAAVVEVHPYKGALDVWLEKPTPSRPPLVAPSEDEDSPRAQVGSFLEDGLRSLYSLRTGVQVVAATTLRHPELPHVLATPDGLALSEDAGLELKVVGANMAHHWADDTVPDYVQLQAVQGMAVTGRGRWDVAALIGGTDFRIHQIYRDLELEDDLLAALTAFWETYVVGDEAPEPRDADAARRLLRLRYPGSSAGKLLQDDREELAEMARWITAADSQLEALKEARAQLVNAMCAEVADDYGISGRWGRFLWYPTRGRVDWKGVAEELSGSRIPEDVVERHRGDGGRVPRLYPPTKPRRHR